MSRDTVTKGLVIDSAERLYNSVNGNPRWRVTFTDGTSALTMSDASVNYDIEPRNAAQKLTVTFTHSGRIRYITKEVSS
jgi:hypothetical protein